MSDVDQLVAAVTRAMEMLTSPLAARLAVLEQTKYLQPEKGEPGPPGRDVDPALLAEYRREIDALRTEVVTLKAAQLNIDVDGLVTKAAALVPPARDGRDADPVDVQAIAVKAAALIPVPKDGRDGKDADPVDLDVLVKRVADLVPGPVNGQDGRDGASVTVADVAPLVREEVAKSVAALPTARDGKDGRDGSSVSMSDVLPVIHGEVVKALAALPAPKDGLSVTVADVTPLIVEEVAKAADRIPAPKDGVGFTGALQDHDGHLILTKSDGSTLNVGRVVGRDGRDVDMGMVTKAIAEEVAKIPPPKDGRDGVDGVGFDDLDLVVDETQKAVSLRFTKGGVVKERLVPIPMDAGVYADAERYRKGNVVNRGGHMWIAMKDALKGVRPGDDPTAWRQVVQRGKEGKQGAKGDKGDTGPDAFERNLT